MPLIDAHNRTIDYLRLGITDRCNLRCRYCMPEEGIDFSHREDLMSYEEMIRLVKVFVKMGVNKLRLTGGEPFVRKDIGMLLLQLSEIVPSIHITTNATLLEEHIPLLKRIGIAGLNISIDSLDRDRFFMITRRDTYDIVMQNIHRCLQHCISTKLNVVVMKGVNDMEIVDFVKFGLKHNIEVRFIEAMPFNEDDGNKNVFMSASEILMKISNAFDHVTLLQSEGSSSSNIYSINESYIFGIIPSYSRSLCGTCNRIRLTPKGEMLTCLYAQSGVDLLRYLRQQDPTEKQLEDMISEAVSNKKKDGFDEEKLRDSEIFNSMTTIGG